MRSWLRDRSMLFQLLAGGLSILAVVVLLWLVVETRFLNELNRVNSRRWAALSIVADLSKARQYESVGDFTQQGALARQFYETGETPALAQHNAAMTQVFVALDTLHTQLDQDQIDTEKRLRAVLATYKDDFDTLVHVYRRRGGGVSGVVGQWQNAIATILSRAKSADNAVENEALHLFAAQRDVLADQSEENVAAITASSAKLARISLTSPGLPAAVSRSDSIFRDYLALSNRIGLSDTAGLHGALLTAANTVQSDVDSLLTDAVQDTDDARSRFTVVTRFGMLCMFGLAALFFYGFAKPIARAIERLASAAAEIGQGQFNVRVDIPGQNELGQLAASFNRMAEQLGSLMKSILQAGSQINTSAAEIATTTRQQQATASEIAATTTEVGSTAKEISATSQELANNMKHVAEVAEQTAALAGSGQSGIALMGTTMRQITEASDSIGARLGTLAEKAGNITSVVTTIAKVADQTNLLSLNAAIEAEKAGEAGRGFSVVAQEIRRLADQTAIATGDIEAIVREIQSAVTAGVMGMDKFSDEIRRGVEASGQIGTQLSEILNQVQTLTPNFEMVNHGMQSQAEAAQQISLALSQLGTAAQQTVESLVQSNRVIEQLNEASRSLQTGVARFKGVTT